MAMILWYVYCNSVSDEKEYVVSADTKEAAEKTIPVYMHNETIVRPATDKEIKEMKHYAG